VARPFAVQFPGGDPVQFPVHQLDRLFSSSLVSPLHLIE
jgi:hypothetical protein